MKKQKFLKNRKGIAFMWMLIVFTVLMILIGSITYITRQDILETKKQRERLQTYYIALAGAEMTYAGFIENDIDEIIKTIKAKTDEIPPENIDIKFGEEVKGIATVTIDKIKKDDINWVRITSIGKLKDKDTQVSTIIRINQDRTNQIVREKFDR